MHVMRIKNRGLISAAVLAGLLVGPSLGVQNKLFAQEASPAASPDVTKELDAMKKRIEQLEAEAKAREASASKPAVPTPAALTRAEPTPAAPGVLRPVFPTLNPSSLSRPTEAAPVDVATTTPLPDPTAQAPATPPPAAAPAPPPVDLQTPFAFADFTWMNAVPRNQDEVLDSKYFSPEIRTDVNYIYDYWHPADHTLAGTTEGERTGEFVIQQANVGGDFHAGAMQMRFLTQIGATSTAVPRNDASYSVGQWQMNDAYRYITEAYAGYHMDKAHGLNFQAGIFMSFIGLFSFYSFDNWGYQPSYVSSNTPWFFSGFRIQYFPTNKLKIEPWYINGWQSYAKYNGHPGFGGQILWRPTANTDFVWNHYFLGTDTLGNPLRRRYHADYSQEWKYYDNPKKLMHRMGVTFTEDFGCEQGGGVVCVHGNKNTPAQNFTGIMAYNRWWFDHDKFGATIGGGVVDNPGRYLVLLPPINGATATTGTPYFPEAPGLPFRAYDFQATFDYMPSQFVTWRVEFTQRGANVPYFVGPGGITPPNPATGSLTNYGDPSQTIPGWNPDLRKEERRWIFALMVKL
jgi:Putative beta-barrel porin-2, OmpL-like. bbp2